MCNTNAKVKAVHMCNTHARKVRYAGAVCTMSIIKHRMFSCTLFVILSSKMEYAILLSTSLGHGVMKPMEPVFLSLHKSALPWLTQQLRVQMQAMTVCSHLHLHLHLNVLMLFMCVFSCSCICV